MSLGTYHCHTTFCDGKNTPEEMIIAAMEQNCKEIGFSAHSSITNVKYTLPYSKLDDYIFTVRQLKEKYRDKINVFLGIEADVVSNLDLSAFEYVIGSVHYVAPQGRMFDVDKSLDWTKMIINDYYHGDQYLFAEAYYAEVETVYERTHCDIIGHFDLLTKFNEKERIFDLNHPRYVAARNRALDVLLSTPAVLEVNTGAISRGYRTTPYPETAVLEKLRDSGKKVVINSDAHSAAAINCEIESSARYLDSIGVEYCKNLNEVLSISRFSKNM